MMDAKLEEVIITELDKKGRGIEGDPVRRILQIWSKEGKLIMEYDPCEKCPHCKKEIRQ